MVPGHEGRSGCAAIPGGIESVEFETLEKVVMEKLPSFARPLFLRFVKGDLETTGTMKQLKVKLRNEGVGELIISFSSLFPLRWMPISFHHWQIYPYTFFTFLPSYSLCYFPIFHQ